MQVWVDRRDRLPKDDNWPGAGADGQPGRNRSILGPMANPEQVALLKKSVKEWNEGGHLVSKPDLSAAHLVWAQLGDVDLRGADLAETNLSEADLIRANLSGANLIR